MDSNSPGIRYSTPGTGRTLEPSERPGMIRNSPGIRYSTPGIGRGFELAERPGRRFTSPGIGRLSDLTDRRGMDINSPGMRLNSPGACRESKRAGRRGMDISTPGTGRESGLAERRGMERDVQSSPFWTLRSFACPPNGLRISCRQGAPHSKALKSQRSRAPKAVNCMRVLARAWRRIIT